jgi:3'5'-cyclic nucleotide phosphodiesterase
VDHPGVPNTQLVKEQSEIAVAYNGKSVAEQNSMDIDWNLLMEPTFVDFRRILCSNDADNMKRFRQLVVNAVMATDIMDADFKKLRDLRWSKAFSKDTAAETFQISSAREQTNRKATIVLEHVIQLSDVSNPTDFPTFMSHPI